MSLTVDYITMPPKSQEISQIQQSEHIKQDVENQQTAAMFDQTVQKETKTAIARRNVNNDELKNDEEGGGKGKYGKNSNGKNKKSSEKDKVKNLNPTEGGLFDIKI